MQVLKIYRVPIIVAVGLLFAISLPYLYAARTGGSDQVFGGFLLNPLDGNSYLAKMYEGWRGEWLFSLPYTAEKGNGSFLFLFYIFLGHAARWLGLSLVLTFHLARLLAALALLVALYRFFRSLLSEPRQVNLAFALGALGSGLGWLALLFGAFTSDFWVAEAYPFLSAYANPHFPLGLALLISLLAPYPDGKTKPIVRRKTAFLASAFLAILSPFGLVIVVMVLGGLLVWEILSSYFGRQPCEGSGIRSMPHTAYARKLAKRTPSQGSLSFRLSSVVLRLPWILLGGAPLLLYEVWVSRADPLLAAWNAQNVTSSPPFWDLVVSLSPALFLALPVVREVLKRDSVNVRLLLIWFGLSLVLLYLPVGLQRRFMMGLYIPLSGLAVLGLEGLRRSVTGEPVPLKGYRLAVLFLFLLALPTNLVVLMAARHGAQTQDPALYLSVGEDQAFKWIESHTPPDALILVSPQTGLYLPAHTGRRVLYGHPFETVNAGVEKEFVVNFYLTGEVPAAAEIERGVDYIFWGPREQQINPIDFLASLPAVYDKEGVKIYTLSSPSSFDD